jgi:parallel beta-helix repeat protein
MINKLLTVGFCFLLIIISFCGCVEQNTQILSKIIYVDEDGTANYTKIQDAINIANVGDTIYVYSGTYPEILNIRKSIVLQGEDTETTIIQRPENISDTLITIFSANEVQIKGFTINNLKFKPYVYESIEIYSDNDVISNNKFISADNADILLNGALNTKIINNTFTSNGILIRLSGVEHLEDWNTQTIENNYINGKPIIYYKNNHHGDIVPSNSGQVIFANCSNFTIENLHLENSYCGIQLGFSSYNNIFNNTIENKNRIGYGPENQNTIGKGIYLFNSNFNNIIGNTVSGCHDGISFTERSTKNMIKNNVLTENNNGIYHYGLSNNNSLINNTILNNEFAGIYLDSFSVGDIVSNNYISNSRYGIILALSCNNNTICRNNIRNNSNYGISIESSVNNVIFLNNFINNSVNAEIRYQLNNSWDNGQKGNYWDDYLGKDKNGDGIGDTPYNISAGKNQDRYPLMNPYLSD